MKKVFCLFLSFILCIYVTGCNAEAEKFTDYSFDYFDTATSIIGFENDEEVFKQNCAKIKEKLAEYHRLYTIYSRYSDVNNIYSVNNSEKALQVDKKIIDMLMFSKDMYSKTGGNVNVAMGSVLSLWHNCRQQGINHPENARLPDMEALKKAKEHTDINKIIIDADTVFLSDPEMSLDVGAVAKGYATEQTALWMEKVGITGYLLNVGGNIRVVGNRPDGDKWQIGLENPNTDNQETPYIEYLELENMSLVTSGTYQRFFTVDGKKYHHIIDPDTLMPAKGFKMISVINESSAVADALSTALFCMSIDEGRKIISSFENTYVLWITDGDEKIYSEGFKNFIRKMEN